MSLSGLMTAMAEYVGDVLVNDCGRPVPDRMLRYHGTIPDDCCSEAGTLAVSWADGRAASEFPSSSANLKNDPCLSLPIYTLTVRYRVCWPVPDVDEGGVQLLDAEWDETAAMLADTADCVARELAALSCAGAARNDPFVAAILAQVSRGWLRYVDVAPSVPTGGCAGVLWRLYAAPTPGSVS